MKDGEKTLEKVLSLMPTRIRRGVSALGGNGDKLCDLRLRAGGALSASYRDRSFFLSEAGEVNSISDALTVSHAELDEVIKRLCAGSVYSFEDCIRKGYIPTEFGRVGVCASVKTRADGSYAVGKISSLVIRIPHRARGAADRLLAEYKKRGISGALVFSSPSGGKTTVLREAAEALSRKGLRVAVADERWELEVLGTLSQCQVYSGFPKSVAIELATRNVSPQLIVCDEIGTGDEVSSILCAQSSGVPLLASAHAGSKAELYKRPHLKKLLDAGIFRFLYDCSRSEVIEL